MLLSEQAGLSQVVVSRAWQLSVAWTSGVLCVTRNRKVEATWMDHDHRHTRDDHTSKVSEKEKEILNDITCVWNLKYDTEELI